MSNKENLEDLSKSDLIKLVQKLEDELAEREDQIIHLKAGGSSIGKDLKMESSSFIGRDFYGLGGVEVGKLLNELGIQDSKVITRILNIFALCKDELREWKEIHNNLNEIVVKELQFIEKVVEIRNSRDLPNFSELRNQWFVVTNEVEALLNSAKKIRYIGKPFGIDIEIDNNGNESRKARGEPWAVDIYQLHKTIDKSIQGEPNWSERIMFRYFNIVPNRWRDIDEISTKFNKKANHHLHQADKNLKSVAERLDGLTMQLKSRGNDEL